MKNQYVGDIGDFGKYSLLRAFIEAGIKVGVNWYLTENDGSNDGKFTKFLKDGDLRRYEPKVFDSLSSIAFKKNKSVADIRKSNVLPGALFYSTILPTNGSPKERVKARDIWFHESMKVLDEADLIYLDPDNGLFEGNDSSALKAEKYVMPDEVAQLFSVGHNVVYYCHKGRRKPGDWRNYISYMFKQIPEAKPAVLTYHKGTQRSFVFLIHEDSFANYRRILDRFKNHWYRIFSEEFTDKGDVAGAVEGSGLTFTKKDGTVVTMKLRSDGQIAINSSTERGTTHVLSPELLCDFLHIG